MGNLLWSREDRSASTLLDRFIVSFEWDEAFANTRVNRQVWISSDHYPILLEAGAFEWGPSPFCFCNSWLLDKQCSQMIKNSLSLNSLPGWMDFVISNKLLSIKGQLKAWHSDTLKKQNGQEKNLLTPIEQEECQLDELESSNGIHLFLLSLKPDLLTLYRRGKRDLIQNSKLKWLILGDENWSFFHCFLVAKKKRSLIPTTSFSEIEHLILDFYSNLCAKADHACFFPSTTDWPVVSTEQNKELTAKFSMLEIRTALKST